MNQFHRMINPNETRYQTDPLFAAKCDKRVLNHEIKKCREEIEDYSISLGRQGNTLQCLLKKLDEVNQRIEKLKDNGR